MLLQNKEDGTVWRIKSGSILTEEQARAKDITGCFLTLESMDTKEEKLFIYSPYGENSMILIDGPAGEEIIDVTPIKDADADALAPLLQAAQEAAIASGAEAGAAREKELINKNISIIINTIGENE